MLIVQCEKPPNMFFFFLNPDATNHTGSSGFICYLLQTSLQLIACLGKPRVESLYEVKVASKSANPSPQSGDK